MGRKPTRRLFGARLSADLGQLCVGRGPPKRVSVQANWTVSSTSYEDPSRLCARYMERVWFLCPGCARRCRALFGGARFRCRRCHGVRYSSQAETKADRATRLYPKAEINELPPKPRGMHWRSYERLADRYQAYDHQWGIEAIRRFADDSGFLGPPRALSRTCRVSLSRDARCRARSKWAAERPTWKAEDDLSNMESNAQDGLAPNGGLSRGLDFSVLRRTAGNRVGALHEEIGRVHPACAEPSHDRDDDRKFRASVGLHEDAAARHCLAIWTGIGAVGALLVGIAVLGEAATPMRVFAAALIVTGIVMMKLSDTT